MRVFDFFIKRFAETYELWQRRPVTALYTLVAIAVLELIAWFSFSLLGVSYDFMGAVLGVLTVIPLCLLLGWWCNCRQLKKSKGACDD